MKNYPLSIQIWIVIAIITLTISVLLAFILPTSLRGFFTKEIYASIRSAQDLVFNQFEGNVYRDFIGPDFFAKDEEILKNIRTVKHFILYDENKIVLESSLPVEFLKKVKADALAQKTISQEYRGQIGREKVFYVVSKGKVLGFDAFLVSYMGDSYREDLVQALFSRLISLVVLVLLFSWIPAILLSKYLSRPLVDLEKKVERLANNNWSEAIDLNRKDEIGRLGSSVEHLRKQLIRQDEAEQSFLQHVSHELKTPVMVIQSFTEAIRDGIYPKGNLDFSLDVISEETSRLEKKIRDLLYLTKLNYLSSHSLEMTHFSLKELIEGLVERFSWYKSDIDWTLDLSPTVIEGDMEKWRVVIENLLDNQIRYAKSRIALSLTDTDRGPVLRVWNDGPAIEENLIDGMFQEFNKGYKGEFGLGLAIVNTILKAHGARIYARNEDGGVAFHIEINKGEA
ncbi:MAG: HAMP domain-containing sensor histidine kinase [Tissierellaceae bacterium]